MIYDCRTDVVKGEVEMCL